MKINKSILKKAIKMWGRDSQIEMIEEECLELALALQKMKRKRGNHEEKLLNTIDEIADVSIMLEQARIIFDGIVPGAIDDRIRFKMTRLAGMIAEARP
ncbi:MAG TPA: hypothetical protein PLV42_07055 [bacterium]|nr:hypothetical protein [bacterium]